jgi:hypothetical protein
VKHFSDVGTLKQNMELPAKTLYKIIVKMQQMIFSDAKQTQKSPRTTPK